MAERSCRFPLLCFLNISKASATCLPDTPQSGRQHSSPRVNMTSSIPARQLQHVGMAQSVPFPWKKIFILGTSPFSSRRALQSHLPSNVIACQHPNSVLDHCQSSLQITHWLITTLSISVSSYLGTNSLHVHLSLRLLHDLVLQHHLRRPPNCNLRWNGHLLIYLRRVCIRVLLGSPKRQGGKEAGASCWIGRNSAQYAGIRICPKFAGCTGRASPGGTA